MRMNPIAKKILKIAIGCLWWAVLIALALTLFSIMGSKLRGEVPRVLGYSVMKIISGSMGDTIPEGSYILIKECDPSLIAKGDIICFLSDDSAIRGFPNTHRVVEEPLLTEEGFEFVTRGDANPANDTVTAKGSRLVGKYVRQLPAVTRFAEALEGGMMIGIMAALLLGIVSIFTFGSIISGKDDPQKAEKAAGETADEKSREDGISEMLCELRAKGGDISLMARELEERGIDISEYINSSGRHPASEDADE